MATANEDLSRRFFDEVCNQRRLDVADEIIAADFVSHIPQSPPAEGLDGLKAAVAVYQEAPRSWQRTTARRSRTTSATRR
ncbi:MAG: hypothetical protein QOE31_1821 [Solirubrobacteraceae bacterium]|nr:hypothetical protein [Solirubrobacteraceae bacterium]